MPTSRSTLAGIVAGGIVGALLASAPRFFSRESKSSTAPSSARSAEAVLSSSAAPSAASSAPVDVLTRATSGDLGALKELEATADTARSLPEAEAIARGRAVLALEDLRSLERSMTEHPEIAADRATIARLHDLAEREPIVLDVLGVLGRSAVPGAADLLHSIWRRRGPTTVGLYARDIIRGPGRPRASDALRVLIELEELLDQRPADPPHLEKRCASVRERLSQATESCDKRALPLLEMLESKTGCGDGATNDCYDCLRSDDLLVRTRDALKKREAPTPWILPGKRR